MKKLNNVTTSEEKDEDENEGEADDEEIGPSNHEKRRQYLHLLLPGCGVEGLCLLSPPIVS